MSLSLTGQSFHAVDDVGFYETLMYLRHGYPSLWPRLHYGRSLNNSCMEKMRSNVLLGVLNYHAHSLVD